MAWRDCNSDSSLTIHQRHGTIGCQTCFKSLEPASSLSKESDVGDSIPYHHLWPNMERFIVQCEKCDLSFCSQRCAESFHEKIGNCCLYSDALDAMAHGMSDNNHDSIPKEWNDFKKVDPTLVLTTRMFCMAVKRYRTSRDIGDPFGGMCGDDTDVSLLEMGHLSDDCAEGRSRYTLQSGYAKVARVMALTEEEIAGPLSLSIFHKLAAVAARNSIGFTTQSPFRSYYRALLRETGGRDTVRHKKVMSELASILGSVDGVLTRSMDRLIEEKVSNVVMLQ